MAFAARLGPMNLFNSKISLLDPTVYYDTILDRSVSGQISAFNTCSMQ